MEAAPRVCTRRRSIVMATFYRLARCWLYSRKAQVGNNQRARETPCDRGGDSAAAMQPRDLPHHSSGVQQLHPARDWLDKWRTPIRGWCDTGRMHAKPPIL